MKHQHANYKELREIYRNGYNPRKQTDAGIVLFCCLAIAALAILAGLAGMLP